MRATVRTTWPGIDRRKLALVASGTLVAGIIATATLTLSDIGSDESHPSSAAIAVVEPVHRPTDRGVAVPWPSSASQPSNGTAYLDANGLPIVPIVALDHPAVDRAEQMRRYMIESFARRDATQANTSDRTTWTFFPGHEGFTSQ